MQKIVFVLSSGLVNAGVPRVLKDIYDGLHGEFQFDFIVQSHNKSYYDDFFIDKGSTIHRLRDFSHMSTRQAFFYRMFKRPFEVFRILRKKEYSVIHCCNGFNGGFDCFVAKKCGIKKRIVHAHGTYKRLGSRLGKISDALSLKLIKEYSNVKIAVSKKAGNSIFGDSDFSVVYNAIDSSLLGLPRELHSGINLIQIGYYSDLKNQMFSLNVLSILKNAGVDATMSFIGFSQQGNEQYLIRMKRFVAENGLLGCVLFLPHDTLKQNIFPKIDYLLLPSKSEGLPLVVLEGQAAGIKCLVSDSVTDEVNVGFTKFLPINEPKQWAETILHNSFKGELDQSRIRLFSTNSFKNSIRHLYDISNAK